MRYDSVVDAIGHTPLVRLRVDAGGVEVYAKLELQNLFAMKDRVAKQVILDARASGALAPGAPIIESSSGTMALGLALVGTYLGHDVHIVTDPRIDPITRVKLETLGCVVHVVEAMTGAGWQSARLERLTQLMSTMDGAFWPRQYSNPQNPLAYRALAAELTADLGRLEVLVGSVGSGGSLCGTARALRADQPELRVVGVDCVGSVLFAQPDRPGRRQSGLGNSLQPENLDYAVLDEVHWLADVEAFAATRRLGQEQKIFAGNTSGSVYQVLSHLATQAAPGTRLVGIFPDRGDRYVETVYSAASAPVATAPTRVPYGTAVSQWSYALLAREHRPRLVFVESNTTGTGMLALRTAARLGTAPVLVTGGPERYDGLAATGCDVVVCDTNEPAALRRQIEALAAQAPLAGVATTSDFYLIAAAQVAARWGLPGNPPDAVTACRDKALTRAALLAAGVGQPRFAVVDSVDQVDEALAVADLPCVVKPADDSGSQHVLLCRTKDAAAAQVSMILAAATNVRGQPSAGTALVEQWLPGAEVSAEMFSQDGDAVCVGLTAKTLGDLPHFVEVQHLFPADLAESTAAEVSGAVRRALTATGITLGASHVEVKLTPTGPCIVEINARLAGGMIPELIRLATGVDLLEQQLRAFAGMPVYLQPQARRHAGIRFLLAPAAGTLSTVDGVEAARRVPGVDRVVLTATAGRRVRRAANAYDRLGYVIAVGGRGAEVTAALSAAAELIEIAVDEEDEA